MAALNPSCIASITEWCQKILEQPKRHGDGCFCHDVILNWSLMIALPQINLAEIAACLETDMIKAL
jgi:hypothetical protein